jgi:hypothetical protein
MNNNAAFCGFLFRDMVHYMLDLVVELTQGLQDGTNKYLSGNLRIG